MDVQTTASALAGRCDSEALAFTAVAAGGEQSAAQLVAELEHLTKC